MCRFDLQGAYCVLEDIVYSHAPLTLWAYWFASQFAWFLEAMSPLEHSTSESLIFSGLGLLLLLLFIPANLHFMEGVEPVALAQPIDKVVTCV